jgi:hypothetical protein
MSVETKITQSQLDRFQKDCSYYADAPVTVEKVNGVLYCYGDELPIRRVEHTFRHTKDTSFGYSKNLKTWYFGLWVGDKL